MAGQSSSQPGVSPNQTLYVTNLPSAKLQKPDLRIALYMLFSTYGPVLDVVALKTMKMRGQAHIVYRDIQTATQAMRALSGTQFLGKNLKIEYAKSKADAIARLDGTLKITPVGAGPGASGVEVTDVQRSIFNAPAPGSGLSGSAVSPNSQAPVAIVATPAGGRGQKRSREEEESESESDVAMEEDSGED